MLESVLLAAATAFALGSIMLFVRRGATFPALVLLLLAAFALRLFGSTLDPLLHQWDEQFHAVVAKTSFCTHCGRRSTRIRYSRSTTESGPRAACGCTSSR